MSSYIRMRKTPKNHRNTYKVIDEQGTVIRELRPGEDGVTDADIKNCHKVDDMEVYENCRCFCPVYPNWLQNSFDAWRAKHSKSFMSKAKRAPMRGEVEEYDVFISYDACMDKEGEESESCIVAEEIIRQQEALSLEVVYLRDVVANFPQAWQEIYQLVLLDGIPMAEVARQRGVTEGAVRKIVRKIKRCISENAELKEIFLGGTGY